MDGEPANDNQHHEHEDHDSGTGANLDRHGAQFGDYQLRGWRIVIRLITNTTNMRTLIGGVSPQVGLGNSMSAVNLVEEGPQ